MTCITMGKSHAKNCKVLFSQNFSENLTIFDTAMFSAQDLMVESNVKTTIFGNHK